MKHVKVGFVAKRTEDGGFVHERDLYRRKKGKRERDFPT